MTAPDLAYVVRVADKPAAGAAIFGKGSGRLRRAFACGGSEFQVLSDRRSAPEPFRPADPCHGPNAGIGVCRVAGAAAGPNHKIKGGKS